MITLDLYQSLPDHKTNNNDNPKNAKEKKKNGKDRFT